jgi:hypothetical protein
MRRLIKALGSRWGVYAILAVWAVIITSLWGGTQPGPGLAVAVLAAALLTVLVLFGAWERIQDDEP